MKSRTQALLASVALVTLASCHSRPLSSQPATEAPGAEAGASGHDAVDEPRTLALLDATVSSDPDAENFQQAEADVDFGTQTATRATLRLELVSPCFPFSNWLEQGVPDGQNWPERCDAFDRTLSVTLDDAASEEGAPGLELLRAVTPFGGPLELEADVTDVVNGLPGSHRLRLRIDTWSDAEGQVSGSAGEWNAKLTLVLEPGTPPRRLLAVTALVLETQTSSESEPVELEVPEGAKQGRIDYRVTGHGSAADPQCLGPAEEFCRREHTLLLDAEPLAQLSPWRNDCAALCTIVQNSAGPGPSSYCAENPCGDPRSVRAPRANWCPGSETPPFAIESPRLTQPGHHELTRTIAELREGGQWRVSASYFAFGAVP